MTIQQKIETLTNNQLIELGEACNSEFPGLCDLAVELSNEFFPLKNTNAISYVGLGCLVAGELAKRLKKQTQVINIGTNHGDITL